MSVGPILVKMGVTIMRMAGLNNDRQCRNKSDREFAVHLVQRSDGLFEIEGEDESRRPAFDDMTFFRRCLLDCVCFGGVSDDSW